MAKIRLIKSEIEKLPKPKDGERLEYFDKKLSGFGLRVTKNRMVYFVLGRVKGRLIRYTIGKHGLITPDNARAEAMEKLVQMENGIDPNKKKAQDRVRGITLKQSMDEYFVSKPMLREGTKRTYKCILNEWLPDWMDRPLEEISKTDVSKRHIKIAEKRSPVMANNVMRTFRAIYNHAREISDGVLPETPTKRLTQNRQWAPVERRKTFIPEGDLNKWYDAVMAFSNPIASDALVLLLLSGCREQEILSLGWDDVNIRDKTFTVRAEISKNHREHTLPMSKAIFDIFNRRLALGENDWVFPSHGPKGRLTELKRAVKFVIDESKVTFCIHDLRRTFASIAEQEVSYAVLKRLLNHYTKNDVTAGYLVLPIEQLRDPMQQISTRIQRAFKAKQRGMRAGKIIPFRK